METRTIESSERLGNLTRRSNLPADRRKGIEEAALALDPREIGVRLFRQQPEPEGAAVEEVEVDPEAGLFPVGYDEIGRALYDRGAAIFHRTRALEE